VTASVIKREKTRRWTICLVKAIILWNKKLVYEKADLRIALAAPTGTKDGKAATIQKPSQQSGEEQAGAWRKIAEKAIAGQNMVTA